MIEETVEIATEDGKTTTFIVYPERGGPFPVILFYMDAVAIREELRDMARRFAAVGYVVVLPNLFYRSGVLELGPTAIVPESPAYKKMFELARSLTVPKIMSDTVSVLKYLDQKLPAARKGPMGCVGYCLSGRFAVAAAAQMPDRFRAAASIHGTGLVTDQPDSPHLMAQRATAQLYFACAENDEFVPFEHVDALRAAVKGRNAEVELYPKAPHGFVFPERPHYDKAFAERHWERLYELFRRNL